MSRLSTQDSVAAAVLVIFSVPNGMGRALVVLSLLNMDFRNSSMDYRVQWYDSRQRHLSLLNVKIFVVPIASRFIPLSVRRMQIHI